jgi:iduronate 2-sulfatase
MHTPAFDKFADEALTFDYTFTNFGICSASRNSFMTGRAPDKTRVWNFINDFRQGGMSDGVPGQQWVTLPEFFVKHNYSTLGHGKLYHPGHPPNYDEPRSWSQTQPFSPSTNSGCPGTRFCPDGELPEDRFSDVNVTGHALTTLAANAAAYKSSGANFALFLGLHYPHQPWFTPEWAVKPYMPIAGIAPAVHTASPKGGAPLGLNAELDGNPDLIVDQATIDAIGQADSHPPGVTGKVKWECPWPGNNSVPIWMQKQLRAGYYSAVTHTDKLFGTVMDALDESGVASDTFVLVTGDHGWQLGEKGEWGKHANYELSVHVPLMIRVPWKPASAGKHTQSLTELLDLYRTLASLAGLPADAIESNVDGKDVSALLDDPTQTLKTAAYSQYSRCPGLRNFPALPGPVGSPAGKGWNWPGGQRDAAGNIEGWYMNNCEGVPSHNITYMGYTVRTATFRYTEWFPWDGAQCKAIWSATVEEADPTMRELYSHEGQHSYPLDFDSFENVNLALEPSHASVVATHRALLEKRFKGTDSEAGCPPDLGPDGEVLQPTFLEDEIDVASVYL